MHHTVWKKDISYCRLATAKSFHSGDWIIDTRNLLLFPRKSTRIILLVWQRQLLSCTSGSIQMHPLPIQHLCNLRVMTCRNKRRNGKKMNVAFIWLSACWNTIMSSIAPAQRSKGTTLSKIWRNDFILCTRCTNGRLCCVFVMDRVLEWNCRFNFGRIGYRSDLSRVQCFVPSFPANTTKSEFVKWFQGLGEYWLE
jgi:hypothetical protein